MGAARTSSGSLVSREEALRAAVAGGAAALAAIGLLLIARRAAGGVASELDAWSLVASLALAATIVFGGRAAWRRLGATTCDAAIIWGGSAALLLFCLGCAWPSASANGWLLWLPLVGADYISRQRFLRGEVSLRVRGEAAGIPPLAAPFKGGESDGVVVQALERVRDGSGVETIRGTLRAEFAAGQRHATLFAGFCPPLARLPVIEVELVDGPDAAVKVVQALAHGVQIELRLAEPAEEACWAAVEISAAPGDEESAPHGPIVPPPAAPL